jgi:pyrimidine operon attenuation protein/uracil phosphoribosyltransferase
MKPRLILDSKKFELTIDRLCYELIENHADFSDSAIIGVQPRGVILANRIRNRLQEITGIERMLYGKLDATFHRDDFGH